MTAKKQSTLPAPKQSHMHESVMRHLKRRTPVAISLSGEGGNVKVALPKGTAEDALLASIQLRDALGSSSSAFVSVALGQLVDMTGERGSTRSAESSQTLNAALAIIEAIRPENELETALAVQMVGTHSLAAEMLCRARSCKHLDQTQAYANVAVKLQRTFTAQIESLSRMRGKSQQTVRVEHVTFEAGAQAIVGDVHHHPQARAGGAPKKEDTIHATSDSGALSALPSPNPLGYTMPIPSDAERPLQNARRAQPGPTERKSKRF